MSNLRVYEAARKLNMSAGELVKILEEKGVQASPISTIEQDLFDSLLEQMVSGAGKTKEGESAPLKLVSFKEKAGKKQNQDPEADIVAGQPAQPEMAQAASAADTPVAEEVEAAAPQADAPIIKEQAAAQAPAAAAARGTGQTSSGAAISYAALALAILLAVGMAFMAKSVNQQSVQIENMVVTLTEAQSRLDMADRSLNLQQMQISQNQTALSDLTDKTSAQAREVVKADVLSSASALEDLSRTLPATQADKIMNISRSLEDLGSAM
ncbi:MAG: translation initiation factor IF-2 N-terminal domain-containing protein [Nitrospinota bacterium]|nr:translation initiation factor IF-2 N-terminal domain-containing protein [Nitrospinota bacterium]